MNPNRTPSKRQRRVICVFVVLLLSLATILLGAEVFVGAAVVFGLFAALFAGLLLATRRLAYRSTENLDERELQLVSRANQQGLAWVLGVIIGWSIYEFVTWRPFGIRMDITLELGEFLFWIGLIFLGPTLYLAWTQPDPIFDEAHERELA